MKAGRTCFVADLHLTDERPAATGRFFRFLDNEAAGADALYILGDLFEAWGGDDHDEAVAHETAERLRRLAAGGTPIYFLHGNRDFMLAERYAARAGMQLIADPLVIDLYGTPTLLMHGDTLCVDDLAYQRFRRRVRRPLAVGLLRALPYVLRNWLAGRARAGSESAKSGKTAEIMDANAAEVERVFYPEIEKLLLEFFPDATDALVYNHDVFDKDYAGDRTEDQDNKNPGVNARYAMLVHNDLNDNSGRVRCRELLTKNLRNFGRTQHYTEEEADRKMSRRFSADARSSMTTSPGPATGSGTSRIANTSGPPVSVSWIACICSPSPVFGERVATRPIRGWGRRTHKPEPKVETCSCPSRHPREADPAPACVRSTARVVRNDHEQS